MSESSTLCVLQEAEHRRITEQHQRQAANNTRQPKHLPDAIIMSLTQRVQQRQRYSIPLYLKHWFALKNSMFYSQVPQPQQQQQQPLMQQQPPQQHISPQRSAAEDKVLSVSGKKKCSHCNLELGNVSKYKVD